MKTVTKIPKKYKIMVIIFGILVLLVSISFILPRATVPVTPPEQPVFRDYLVAIVIASGEIIFITIITTIIFSLFLLWFWCFTDIIQSKFKGENDKIIWIFLNILTGLIGSLLYLTIGTRQKTDYRDKTR